MKDKITEACSEVVANQIELTAIIERLAHAAPGRGLPLEADDVIDKSDVLNHRVTALARFLSEQYARHS